MSTVIFCPAAAVRPAESYYLHRLKNCQARQSTIRPSASGRREEAVALEQHAIAKLVPYRQGPPAVGPALFNCALGSLIPKKGGHLIRSDFGYA